MSWFKPAAIEATHSPPTTGVCLHFPRSGGLLVSTIIVGLAMALASPQCVAQSKGGITIGGGVAGALFLLDKLSSSERNKSKSSRSSSSSRSKSSSSKSRSSESTRSASKKNTGSRKARVAKSSSNSEQSSKTKAAKQKNRDSAPDDAPVAARSSDSGVPPPASVSPAVSPPAARAVAAASASSPSPIISSQSEIAAAQDHLRYLGYAVPASSGQIDLDTRIAVMKYQDSIGAPPTGDLTVAQLQTLFVAAAAKQKTR